MRIDGRKNDELRRVDIEPNYISYPEGSVLISIGKTKIICNATVQEGIPRWMETNQLERGWISSEYALLPRSTHHRTSREIQGFTGRTQEIKRMIGRSLRAAVDLSKIGKNTIIIDCDVIQADGGTRTASITGGYIALYIALGQMMKNGILTQNPLISPVAAVSVGIVNDIRMIDLCYEEDSQAQVDINVVMNAKGQYIELQGTAEKSPFVRADLGALLDMAYKGIGKLLSEQRNILDELGFDNL